MAGFVRLFSIQSRIKFWCSLIEMRSETRHMLIAQTVLCNLIVNITVIYDYLKFWINNDKRSALKGHLI